MTNLTYSEAEKLYPIAVAKHENAIQEQSKDADKGSGFLNEELSKRELEARLQRESLEIFFKNYVKNNLNWSTNDIYIRLNNKHVAIHFHPTTSAYEKYGRVINGSFLIEESIVNELDQNKDKRVESFVKFEVNESKGFSDEKANNLKVEGFHCRDIESVEGYNI